jgi:hypothetical protein
MKKPNKADLIARYGPKMGLDLYRELKRRAKALKREEKANAVHSSPVPKVRPDGEE